MKNKKIIVLLAVVVFLVQAACSTGTTATQAPAPTQDVNAVVATNVALTQAAAQPLIISTNTSAPVVVPPTVAPVLPTTAPVALVQGAVNYGANCRSGPGANFPALVVLVEGTKVDVIGKADSTDKVPWWQVRSSGQPDCWLVDGALTITGDKGSVAVVVSPPTPTPQPVPTWNGIWTSFMRGGFSGAADETISLPINQSGNEVSSTFFAYGFTFFLTGTVSADGMTVKGDLTRNPPGSWTVVLKRNPSNLKQFRGSWSLVSDSAWDGDWCGSVDGSKPSPCKTH